MNLNLPDKLYYSIGEVAKAFNVNSSLIRYWEKEFDVLNPKKNKKGNRYFSQGDLKNLITIYHLVKERGYTLEGAKGELKHNSNLESQIEIITHLKSVRNELIQLKEYFDEIES